MKEMKSERRRSRVGRERETDEQRMTHGEVEKKREREGEIERELVVRKRSLRNSEKEEIHGHYYSLLFRGILDMINPPTCRLRCIKRNIRDKIKVYKMRTHV